MKHLSYIVALVAAYWISCEGVVILSTGCVIIITSMILFVSANVRKREVRVMCMDIPPTLVQRIGPIDWSTKKINNASIMVFNTLKVRCSLSALTSQPPG